MKAQDSLRKKAARLAPLRQELIDFDKLGSQLRADEERLIKVISDADPTALLRIHPGAKEESPAEVSDMVSQVYAIRDKISLLPGARSNLERKVWALAEELKLAYEKALSDYQAAARAKLDCERKEIAQSFLGRCAGNAQRAELAAKR